MSPFAQAVLDAHLSIGEADRLQCMVTMGCDKMLALRRIVDAREQART